MINAFPETLTEDIYYKLMSEIGAVPTYATSNGKRVMMLRGLCHHSHSGHYSVIFDFTDTHKITCMSECGDTVLWWNYIKRALDFPTAYETKEWIIDWLNGKKIDIDFDINNNIISEEFKEKPFNPKPADMVPGIEPVIIEELYNKFEDNPQILKDTIWCKEDGIKPEILALYDVAVYPDHETIILPHHNVNGEIVGIYERNFNMLRSEAKKRYPEMPYRMLVEYPRAKYTPLVKEGIYADENEGKTSWSFPNSKNLYGLHLAKDSIKETKTAIIVEGAKSVMLARQYGYNNVVASHTFGANENHIAMLIAEGAENIYFAFDKQYQIIDADDKEWKLYEKKTKELANRIKDYVNVYRICDRQDLLKYKDAPLDDGKRTFDLLYKYAEPLAISGKIIETKPALSKKDYILNKISIKLDRKKQAIQFNEQIKNWDLDTKEE